MTKQKAEQEARIKDLNFLNNTFCPLVKGRCHKDCVCFCKSGLLKDADKSVEDCYDVMAPCCNNSMFFG